MCLRGYHSHMGLKSNTIMWTMVDSKTFNFQMKSYIPSKL